MNKMCLLVLGLLLMSVPVAYADQGSFSNSGYPANSNGSATGNNGITIISSAVSSPAGTLNITCYYTGPATCGGEGSQPNDLPEELTLTDSSGNIIINAEITGGTYTDNCSQSGTSPKTCYYSFTGYFTGTWTVNGLTQAITGVTYQSFPDTTNTPLAPGTVQGTTAFNSSYAPFYYSDTESILRSDDLMGTNQISYDAAALGGLYGAQALALDAQGRIYIADTFNCRIVRTDDMNGTNAISFGGSCGSGTGRFNDPTGIAVDSHGKIYIMDTGNSRFVRIDNMRGKGWTTYSAGAPGAGQFASFRSVAIDSTNHIYIADTQSLRIVRIDDMIGTNWTVLTQYQTSNGNIPFVSPVAVAVDSAGKIYIADNQASPAVVRVDNMGQNGIGPNGITLSVGPVGINPLNSISVDSGGTVFTGGGGGVENVDNMAGVLTSSGTIGPIGSAYVFGVTPLPVSSPPPSAISTSPSTLSIFQSPNTTSPPQPITVSNNGGNSLTISAISVSGTGFAQINGCIGVLAVGSTCTVNVTFAPTAVGIVNATLTFSDNSGNLGAAQTLNLTGIGTGVALSPSFLNFGSLPPGKTSAAKTVTLTNYQNVQLNNLSFIASPSPAFATPSYTCGTFLVAGASCTVSVTFTTPNAKGALNGQLTFTDDVGMQYVTLTGNVK